MSVLRRAWNLVRRSRLERELGEEMAWHLERRTRELVDQGLDEPSARDAALRAFGNLTHHREESRDSWGFAWLELLVQDTRHAGRTLVRQPMLSAIAVFSLGAGMAAACAVFSLADSALFASLPVPNPSALVVARWVSGPTAPYESIDGWSYGDGHENRSTSFSYDAFRAARARLEGQADVFGFADLYQVNVSADGQSDVATGQLVSGNYYAALGVRPAAGRLLAPADDRMDAAEMAAVISHAFWQRRFGGRPGIVGAAIRINQVPAVIVGVAPPGFEGTRQVGETADISMPLTLRERIVRSASGVPGQTADDELRATDPRYWWVIVMARMEPAADPSRVQREMELAVRSTVDVPRQSSGAPEPFRVVLDPGRRGMSELRGELVHPLAIMAAIVALVIVIACANLATLLLARGVARDREVAVRHALGASRARLVRAAMIESLLVGLSGGVVGLVGSRWVAQGLVPALGLGPTSSLDGGANGPVLAFAFGAALVVSLLFGFIPAWRGSDPRSMRAMQDGTGRVASRVPRLRTARAILVFQVALSVVMLAAAGLLAGTLRNLQRVDPGFDPANVLLFRVDPALNGYDEERRRRVLAEILERVRALPGVDSASLSQHALLSRSSSNSMVNSVGGIKLAQPLMASRLVVDGQFLRTMRIPLLAGSTLERAGAPGAVRPVIVNRVFADRAFHSTDPIGRRFRFSDRADKPSYEVVGVAGDVRLSNLRQPAPPTVYQSYQQETIERVDVAVRAARAPASLIPAIRRAVASVDPDLPIDRIRTEDDQIAAGFERERLFATLASALGLLALLLACIGIYGVIAYAVSRRTTEIGVRLALGARPTRILLMVASEAGRVVAGGAVLGLAGSFVATRYLGSLLFGLAPHEPVTLSLAVAMLGLVAAAAALIPARRAALTDPLVALRHE